jgi:hypothetical protein
VRIFDLCENVRDTPPLLFGENPLLRSGLALAGANARHSGTKDDGILKAAEVAQLELAGSEETASIFAISQSHRFSPRCCGDTGA